MQGSNRIFDSLCHLVYFGLLSNVLATHDSLDSSFHTGKILVVIFLQSICLGNGFINLCVVSVFVLQGCNRIFNSLCHCIYFALLGNVLATHNSVDSGFYTGEILVVVLVQGIRLGNGFVNFGVISPLVLQGCNRIFDRFRHCIYFGLLRNVLTTHNGIHCGVYTGEILVVILVQGIRLGNGFVNFGVVRPLVLQGCNRIFNCLCHCIHFTLLGNVLVTDNGIDSSFHSGEILVVVLVQCIRLGNSLINFGVVRILVLQSCNRIFNCLCHCIYFALLGNIFATHNSVDSSFHSSKILVVILVQVICLGNCCINISIVGRLDALQGKGSLFILSTVIFVSNGVLVTIHCQRISTYFPTTPVACLGNIEVSRQGGKVKCAVIANNDLVDIIVTIQVIHICVAEIQRGQLVLVAV